MSSPNEINNVASMATNAKSAIVNKNTSYQNASGLGNCKGDIAQSIKSANISAKNKVNSLMNSYSSLNTKLTSLSNAVQRAESKKTTTMR